MELLNHDLAHEFPQYLDKMRALSASNPRFAHLVEQFNATNKAVTDDEQDGGHMCDENLEDLKKTRLKLKDEIFRQLQS